MEPASTSAITLGLFRRRSARLDVATFEVELQRDRALRLDLYAAIDRAVGPLSGQLHELVAPEQAVAG